VIVAYRKCDRAIEAGKRADLEGLGAPFIQNDSHISSCVIRIDAKAHDPAKIVDPERRDKETAGRRRLRNDGRAGTLIDHSPLKTSTIDRAYGDTCCVYAGRIADCFTGGKGKLGNYAVLPDKRQPV